MHCAGYGNPPKTGLYHLGQIVELNTSNGKCRDRDFLGNWKGDGSQAYARNRVAVVSNLQTKVFTEILADPSVIDEADIMDQIAGHLRAKDVDEDKIHNFIWEADVSIIGLDFHVDGWFEISDEGELTRACFFSNHFDWHYSTGLSRPDYFDWPGRMRERLQAGSPVRASMAATHEDLF